MKMLDINQLRNAVLIGIKALPGADKKSIAIQARGFESPMAYHHFKGLRPLVEIVGVFKYSSSSSIVVSVPKSSSSVKKSESSRVGSKVELEDCEEGSKFELLLGL